MADKPGVLVISVDMIISSLENESTVLALPYSGYSNRYVQQMESILVSYAEELLEMSDQDFIIRLLLLDDGENIGEARTAAKAIVAYEHDRGVGTTEVVDYDTDGFKRLVERVSETISKFREDPDYGHRDKEYICDQVDELVFAITG
jgi:hypothetical protein